MTNAEKVNSDGTMAHQSEELTGIEVNQTTGAMKIAFISASSAIHFGTTSHVEPNQE